VISTPSTALESVLTEARILYTVIRRVEMIDIGAAIIRVDIPDICWSVLGKFVYVFFLTLSTRSGRGRTILSPSSHRNAQPALFLKPSSFGDSRQRKRAWPKY
jgi:hypothetical protein